ncbi:MAG: hypothetical protein P4L99_01365 [Chthoniobacter sp.]|nr:hypothetical protein [Chthoniobacter sp.]
MLGNGNDNEKKRYGNGRAMGDIQAEREIENAVARLICALTCFDEYELAPDKKFPDYDFAIVKGAKRVTFELKHQILDTGNVFVEIQSANTGRPSGLMVTRCQKWAEYIEPKNLLAVTSPKELKALIEAHPEFRRIENAGDGSVGILIPLPIFLEVLKPRTYNLKRNFGRN